MNAEQIAGIVRAVVAALGGFLVAKGVADAETVAAVAGALATLAAAAWSVLSKQKPEAA
jgi:hypothetical protein